MSEQCLATARCRSTSQREAFGPERFADVGSESATNPNQVTSGKLSCLVGRFRVLVAARGPAPRLWR